MVKRVARIFEMRKDRSARVIVEEETIVRIYDLSLDKVSTLFWHSLVNPWILVGSLIELHLSSDENEIISASLMVSKS